MKTPTTPLWFTYTPQNTYLTQCIFEKKLQLGIGHTTSRDSLEKICLPKSFGRQTQVKMVRCGDWGTAVVVSQSEKK